MISNLRPKHKLLLVIAGALLTVAFGAYNNFPFIYPDSNAYLFSSHTFTIPLDRPVFYGVFLRITHLAENLYFTMFAQSLLLAYTLYLPFRLLRSSNYYGVSYLFTLAVLTLCTGYSFYACYLMPDFFGMILFITSWLLFAEKLETRDTVVCSILLVCSILVHNANFYIYLLLLGFTGLFFYARKAKEQAVSFKKWVGLNLGIILLVVVLQANFSNKPSGYLFLTSRLNETGILSDFLHRKCDKGNYALCAYKDSLVGDFLWDTNSPMAKIGGWDETLIPEYNRMLRDMILDPHTFKKIAGMSFYSTVEQFFSFEIEPQQPFNQDYIQQIFAAHKFDTGISFQNRGNRLSFSFINDRQWLLIIFCLALGAVILLYGQNLPLSVRRRFTYLFVFLGVNAAVFATFSTVLTRYQGRVIAMLPYLILLSLPDLFPFFKNIFFAAFKADDGKVE